MGSDIWIPECTSPNELHTDTIHMYGGAKQGRIHTLRVLVVRTIQPQSHISLISYQYFSYQFQNIIDIHYLSNHTINHISQGDQSA